MDTQVRIAKRAINNLVYFGVILKLVIEDTIPRTEKASALCTSLQDPLGKWPTVSAYHCLVETHYATSEAP